MNKKIFASVFAVLLVAIVFGACQKKTAELMETKSTSVSQTTSQPSFAGTISQPSNITEIEVEKIIEKYKNQVPSQWSEKINGIVDTFVSEEKAVALTFDACGGPNGIGFDKELIDFLIDENINATLFVNKRWIENNRDVFLELAQNPLFEIENHGFEHRPLSVSANEIYGINGTGSPQRVVDEIKMNENLIFELTGKRTKFFRSGTAYYDDVAVQMAQEMGYKIAGFQINGDGGATFSESQIHTAMSRVKSGDIVISHFNKPEKNTYEGLRDPILKLKADGYKFLKLDEAIK